MSAHPMQAELKSAMEARDVATATVSRLQAKYDELAAGLETFEEAVLTAKTKFQAAAGAHALNADDAAALTAARKAYRAASSDLDEAVIAAQGVADCLVLAEADSAAAEKTVAGHTSALALLLASRAEAEVSALAGQLGQALARHRAIAILAGEAASIVAGHLVEPIDVSSPSTPIGRHVAQLMTVPAGRVSLGDLLNETVQ